MPPRINTNYRTALFMVSTANGIEERNCRPLGHRLRMFMKYCRAPNSWQPLEQTGQSQPVINVKFAKEIELRSGDRMAESLLVAPRRPAATSASMPALARDSGHREIPASIQLISALLASIHLDFTWRQRAPRGPRVALGCQGSPTGPVACVISRRWA
jgi:hypothetical protein